MTLTWKIAVFVAVALFGVMFAGLASEFTEPQSLSPLAREIVTRVPHDLGAPNIVTGILLTLRGFDTLGEVAVLFMVAAGVGLLLKPGAATEATINAVTPASELVRSGATVLLPLIAIFAVYIVMNGHISAGGGFQGGAVIASGVMLLLLANPEKRLNLGALNAIESLAGILFVLVGIAGLIWADGFLDNRMLPLGQFGAFFSAGAIPIISILLGIKVGCELSVVIDRFRT
jgi:multicomponent Na+:H+ antiporter subunit B